MLAAGQSITPDTGSIGLPQHTTSHCVCGPKQLHNVWLQFLSWTHVVPLRRGGEGREKVKGMGKGPGTKDRGSLPVPHI